MDRLRNLLKENPKIKRFVIGFLLLYVLRKVYKKWRYSQRMFTKENERNSKVVLITGCDTGFGNAIALKLSIKHGYRVIATCLNQESVNKFLSNSAYTKNKSTSVTLDITKKKNITSVKEFTIKYLNDNNSTLWGIVNNAGMVIPGSFEMVPYELDMLNRNVLFLSPLDIIRSFLPLLEGRKNYSTKAISSASGGRIVNIASAVSHLICDTRYGVSKASMSYFSHALRLELSPRFGIWVSAVEPGPFGTTLWKHANIWSKRVIKKLEENKQTELMKVYDYKPKNVEPELNKYSASIEGKVDAVIDSVIHGLISKHPQRYYRPGWTFIWHILTHAPHSIVEGALRRNVMNHSGMEV